MSDLTYPFPEPPAQGEMITIAPGIHWLQMPLPMALDHINLYILDDGDDFWIVDTGMKWGEMHSIWESVFAGPLAGRKCVGVICTHMHPDHIGMAGWLCEKWRVPFYMSYGEYYQARAFMNMTADDLSWTSEEYYIRQGMSDEYIADVRKKFVGFKAYCENMPGAFRRLKEGDALYIGNRGWQVKIGRGHSPEHVCLYSASDKVLLSGDQIIPRITSNISLNSVEPGANPLGQWFKSLRRFLSLPMDTLVCPSHNMPFYGIRHRLQYLIRHHEEHLCNLEEACASGEPSCHELLPVLFKRPIGPHDMGLALGECAAHLNYLTFAGRLARELDERGTWRYRRAEPSDAAASSEILIESPSSY